MKITVLALLLSLSFNPFSCSKDKAQAAQRVAGVWVGTYTVDQLPDMAPQYYKFTINANGDLTTEGQGDDGVIYYHKGTWKLKGNLFTATYTTLNPRGLPVTQSAKMTLNSDGIFTNGVWTDVKNPHGHLDGKFQTFTRSN